MYDLLKSCQLASSLEALQEVEYRSRTSDREFLHAKKQKQIREIQTTLTGLSMPLDINFHRTFLSKTNATVSDLNTNN